MEFFDTNLGIFLIILSQCLLVMVLLLVSLAFLLYMDRKVWAAVQLRKGPNVVGFDITDKGQSVLPTTVHAIAHGCFRLVFAFDWCLLSIGDCFRSLVCFWPKFIVRSSVNTEHPFSAILEVRQIKRNTELRRFREA